MLPVDYPHLFNADKINRNSPSPAAKGNVNNQNSRLKRQDSMQKVLHLLDTSTPFYEKKESDSIHDVAKPLDIATKNHNRMVQQRKYTITAIDSIESIDTSIAEARAIIGNNTQYLKDMQKINKLLRKDNDVLKVR